MAADGSTARSPAAVDQGWRITKRTLGYWRKERPDMPAGCRERFDLEFYRYVATYNLKRRNGVLHKVDRYRSKK